MEKCPGVESGNAGKAESCKGCPNAKICASAKPDEDIEVIKNKLKHIKCIISILSGKGGVGKSTISRNLAAALAKSGVNTLILDLDLSGPSIPRLTNTIENYIFDTDETFKPIKVENRLYAISLGHLEATSNQPDIYNTAVKNFAIKKILKFCDFSSIDIIVIDTPPNITDEHFALVNYIKPDMAIIITTPQNISFDDSVRQVNFCKKTNIPILGIVENMKGLSCGSCGHFNKIFSSSGVEEYCNKNELPYLGFLELKSNIARESDQGKAVDEKIFGEIAQSILGKILNKPDS